MKRIAWAAAAVVAMWAGSVEAATVIATFTGTVRSGEVNGVDVTGDTATAAYTFDDPNYVLGSGEIPVNGSEVGTPFLLQSIELTFGTITYSPLIVPNYSELFEPLDPVHMLAFPEVSYLSGTGIDVDAFIQAPLSGVTYGPDFQVQGVGGGGIITGDPSTEVSYDATTFSLNTFVTPIPEPGVWILTLSGLGAIGAMVRGRKNDPTSIAPVRA